MEERRREMLAIRSQRCLHLADLVALERCAVRAAKQRDHVRAAIVVGVVVAVEPDFSAKAFDAR